MKDGVRKSIVENTKTKTSLDRLNRRNIGKTGNFHFSGCNADLWRKVCSLYVQYVLLRRVGSLVSAKLIFKVSACLDASWIVRFYFF